MKPNKIRKSLRMGLIVLAGLVVYGYGFQVTQVDLDEFRSEERQNSRIRVLRALSRPDIIKYDQEEFIVTLPVMVPCPAEGYTPPDLDTDLPYMVMSPPCSAPGTEVAVEGFNFTPNSVGPLSFIPSDDPTSTLALRSFRVLIDGDGHFMVTYELPERPLDGIQYLRATTRRNVGSPYFSENAKNTFEKIIETIFLALLATTIGIFLAVPLSFIAARNLMKDVKSRLTSIAFSTLGWLIGILVGFYAARVIATFRVEFISQVWLMWGGLIIGAIAVVWALRWALRPNVDEPLNSGIRFLRWLVLILSAVLSILVGYLAADVFMSLGNWLEKALGPLGFLGDFVFQIGDIFGSILPAVVALGGGAFLGNLMGRAGQLATERLPSATTRILNLIFAGLAGAILFGLMGMVVTWLYQLSNQFYSIYLPAIVGAALSLILALISHPTKSLPTGIVIYYITRTILNIVRSIDALIMAIVAVIWVGIGPFAGTLALGLHTVVALAKLYSEQVESIMPGPLEAVTATGANRLQTIVYAVIPQIVPPYISFTIYRWDINVRMSTIIGFVGGGGIGLLLQQNINLLNYRAASAQMLAIAIVVAIMDYVSSDIRERFV